MVRRRDEERVIASHKVVAYSLGGETKVKVNG